MMQQNRFVSKFPKKCDVGQHFWFCCILVTWWRCVVHPWHMTADLDFFFDNFKFTNSNKKYWMQPTITILPSQSCEEEKEKNQTPLPWWQWMQLAIAEAISLTTAHFGCCGCTDGCSPQATMPACLIVARAGRQLFGQLR